MATEVTDPNLIAQLESASSSGKEVTDPNLISQLESGSGNSSQPQNSPILDQVSSAAKVSPLGMVSQGANSINEGMSKVGSMFPINVPPMVQQGAQALFHGARALGVGVANKFDPTQTPIGAAQRTAEAFKPNFQPQGPIEKAGAILGENAPVAAATMFSPTVGGPLSMMAQQAETGKVSPVPLVAGLASKGISKLSGPVSSMGESMQDTSGKMANAVADVLPNTVKKLAYKFSPTGNPSEAGSAIGQKLMSDGVLEGNNISEIWDKVKNKADTSGKMVGDAIKAIQDESNKYGEIENPTQIDAKTALQPLQDQVNELSQGRLSGTRAMGTPVKQMLESLNKTADKNGGFLSFDDIEGARKEAGTLLSKTPYGTPKYSLYADLYGSLAEIRNNVVDTIADNANNPEIASNLKKANSEYHFYDSILKDVAKSGAKEGAGRSGLVSDLQGSMGKIGALYALGRGKFTQAGVLAVGGKLLPAVSDEMSSAMARDTMKVGQNLQNKAPAILKSVPQATTGSLESGQVTQGPHGNRIEQDGKIYKWDGSQYVQE